MMFITRREHFNAAHRLYREDYSDSRNLEVFGKCSNPNWHGHNYVLYVTIKGEVSPETGFVANLKTLGEIIHQHIIDKIDHKNMNIEVDFMKGRMASTENLAKISNVLGVKLNNFFIFDSNFSDEEMLEEINQYINLLKNNKDSVRLLVILNYIKAIL